MLRRLAALLFLVALALGARTSRASALPERAILELSVNGAARGEVMVVLRDGDVLVPFARLRDAGLIRLDAPTEVLFGTPHVSLEAASSSLEFSYDEEALTLTIVAKPSVLNRTVVDLSASRAADLRYEYDPSLFFNYAPRLIDGTEFQTFGEAGLALGIMVAETSANYDPDRGATRLRSSVSFDDRDNLRTATLGDAFISTGPLGGSILLGGLSLARNDELDPYLIKIPRLGYTGETMAPGTVDVYVNDVLVRRVPVAPGEFELINITPVSGAGTTRYVLNDAFGRQQRLESAYYASSSMLAPGLSEYNYGIGFARENFGTESWSYGEPTLAAQHRLGVTRHLTVGYHAEFDRTRANVGTDFLIAGDFGEVEVAHASSTTTDALPARGSAALVGYGYRWPRGGLRTATKLTSAQFSTLTLEPESDRALIEQMASSGLVLSSRTNVATNIAFAWLRDSGPGAQFGATLNTQLTQLLSLQVRATRGRTWLSGWEHDVFGTFSWSLPERHSAQVIGHAGSEESDVTARVARSVRDRTDIGYELSGSYGQTPRAAGVVRGQAPFGRAAATYTNTDGDQHTLLEASGGIVLVAGDVYFTLPAQHSFAVLEIPGVEGVRGYLNNREMGRTDGDGRLFIPGLQAYQGNRLRIDQSDLPFDHGLEEDEIVLAPPTRGGAVVRFASRALRLVRGRVVQAAEEASGVSYGTLHVKAGDHVYVSPTGAAGEFELDSIPEGSWTALVRSEQGVCVATLNVASSDELIQDLGAVLCTAREEGANSP
jgi:outer membrane usher protein